LEISEFEKEILDALKIDAKKKVTKTTTKINKYKNFENKLNITKT
jgi:hypothetical protein